MTVRIDDVAKLAGVSKTTVSRVLNKRGYLSEKTIKKVYDAMEQLNYRPNVIARQLFKQETKMIGLIFPTLANPFFGQMASVISERLFEKGYRVLVGDALNDPNIERKYLQDLLAHQVDGLIVGSHNTGISEYDNSNMPIIAIDRRVNNDIPIISSDNYNGGLMATELLIKNGARNIVHTNDPKSLVGPPQNQERKRAYVDSMIEHGLKPIVYSIDPDLSDSKKRKIIMKIFKDNPNIDGMFISNDIDAARVMDIAHNLGYKIPDDLKIVGYDGADVTRVMNPCLTTIVQPIDKMAEATVDMLMKRIKNPTYGHDKILPVKLWAGKSV
ncbi:LacI family DNA-binding transcriptional regulator [Companilactobacillus nuruki]|uniref:LacI family transcriptional regulator n=1 Tax=Companilactobacillus nuruki TaxID=1993540 RepID=A0A2N7AS68_9LACO|nr:LacI family DNA-binding transcriptional regulator [Companilactobacillus nuruki]PMD68200.1 LacI family transcriptional regulator [Companilactobacillus nuruki]